MRPRIVRTEADHEALFGKRHDESKGPRLLDPVEEERAARWNRPHPALDPNETFPDRDVSRTPFPGQFLLSELYRQRNMLPMIGETITAEVVEQCRAAQEEEGKPAGYLWQIPGLKPLIYRIYGIQKEPLEPGEQFLDALYDSAFHSHISGGRIKEHEAEEIRRLCEEKKIEAPGFFDKIPGLKEKVNYFYWFNFK